MLPPHAPAIAACLWVIAAAGTAMLPMRLQYVPGLTLLLMAPGLVMWLGLAYGWLAVGIGLFAVLSMFRRPLRFLAARAIGRIRGTP